MPASTPRPTLSFRLSSTGWRNMADLTKLKRRSSLGEPPSPAEASPNLEAPETAPVPPVRRMTVVPAPAPQAGDGPVPAAARADSAEGAGTRSASSRASAVFRPACGGPNKKREGRGGGRLSGGPDYPGRRLQRRKSPIECAVEFGLLGDGSRQLRLHGGPLAACHVAAPQLGPQFLDVVVKRDHRPLRFRC